LNLLIHGVSRKSTEALLHSTAAAFGIDVVDRSDIDPRKGAIFNTVDWDLLALGPDLYDEKLPPLVERLSVDHPSGLILVLGREGDDALGTACLKAGAIEILRANPSRIEVELAIGRAATLLHRFGKQIREEKLHGISQLAVSVNHEINNPLMGLMGTVEMVLMENEDLSEKMKRDLRTVIDQARRIQAITLRLRDLNHLRTIPYDDRASMIDLLGGDESDLLNNRQAGSDEPISPAADAKTPTPTEVFGLHRILIVDDNQLIIDLIHRLLDERYEIDHSTRPSQALGKIRRTRYDLILIDLMLPEMDGLELFRAIKQTRPDQRVILTTGYDSDPRVGQALEEGALNWIQKPFKFEALEQMLNEALKPGGAVGR
jgi:CheY-like chemotaxis protein